MKIIDCGVDVYANIVGFVGAIHTPKVIDLFSTRVISKYDAIRAEIFVYGLATYDYLAYVVKLRKTQLAAKIGTILCIDDDRNMTIVMKILERFAPSQLAFVDNMLTLGMMSRRDMMVRNAMETILDHCPRLIARYTNKPEIAKLLYDMLRDDYSLDHVISTKPSLWRIESLKNSWVREVYMATGIDLIQSLYSDKAKHISEFSYWLGVTYTKPYELWRVIISPNDLVVGVTHDCKVVNVDSAQLEPHHRRKIIHALIAYECITKDIRSILHEHREILSAFEWTWNQGVSFRQIDDLQGNKEKAAINGFYYSPKRPSDKCLKKFTMSKYGAKKTSVEIRMKYLRRERQIEEDSE